MILVVPALTAVTTPVDGSTVATAVLLLLQAPAPPPRTTPEAEYVAVALIQSGDVPDTEATAAFGVTIMVPEALVTGMHPDVERVKL